MRYAFLLIFLILFLPFMNSFATKEIDINVAIYFSGVRRFAEEVEDAIDYTWFIGNVKYTIKPKIITKEDIINGKLAEYDVFIVPGAARSYFDAYIPKWREEVIKFVANGGGYIGICGGANLASMGFNEKVSLNGLINFSVLKIANVYVNDQQDEEWQYLWKSNWRYGGIPINVYIPKNNIPIFEGFYGSYRSIRYWGGPGMYYAGKEDKMLGEVIPLAIYAEEPMEIAPLHYWKKINGEWIPYKIIKTDIKGQYAAIATTYGKGRIVLFGPHPERNTFFDGYVEEFPVRQRGPTWFIYNWVSNNSSNVSYNWWILRRSIAWTAGIDKMPDADEIAGYIEEPRYGIFLNGRKLIYWQRNIVIGNFYLHAKAIGAKEGIISVDGKEIYKGNGDIILNLKLPIGKHIVCVEAKNDKEIARNKIEILSL